MMKKQEEYKQKIFGEYVATPIKNAFNSKTAYWLSKANCTVSIYMFTCENGYSEKEMFSDMNLATYIAMLEEKCKRAHDHVIYMEEYRTAREYLKKLMKKEAAQKELQKCGRKYNRNLLGGLYRENPVKSRNYEAVKSSKKWENVGNSYIIPALLLYRYSYI